MAGELSGCDINTLVSGDSDFVSRHSISSSEAHTPEDGDRVQPHRKKAMGL